ncbi:hypothetical protein [Altererythrobacter lauratis]|uniref:Uncharacterized protein n=1 Tax=Alteraurantiacibacter lauratis TaxID=2054627 RepID=A0ABV7EC97_9SPHN
MRNAIALTRRYAADPADALRSAIVLACAAALILAGSALPF